MTNARPEDIGAGAVEQLGSCEDGTAPTPGDGMPPAPVTVAIRRTSTPARDLPAAMWVDVAAVLQGHGLLADALDVMQACSALIRRTPVDRGGRLLPDGTVDE